MKHLVYIVYIITIICGGGWYIREQRDTISEQDRTIQELTVNQRPPVVPVKRKIKYVDKIVVKEVKVKDEKCAVAYEELRQKTYQCAYNLKFCQESNKLFDNPQPKADK